jgi:hypothetical protein
MVNLTLYRALLLVRHRHVRCAEINSSVGDAFYAATGAVRGVINLDVVMQLVIIGKPLLVNGVRKTGAASVDLYLRHGERHSGRCHYPVRYHSFLHADTSIFPEQCYSSVNEPLNSARRVRPITCPEWGRLPAKCSERRHRRCCHGRSSARTVPTTDRGSATRIA